jgi:hypothetical protein
MLEKEHAVLMDMGHAYSISQVYCRDVYDVFSYKLVYAYLDGLSNFHLTESE